MGLGGPGRVPGPPCLALALCAARVGCGGGRHFSGAAMRAAVRLWLDVAPRSTPPAPRYRCGADVDSDGRHLLFTCPQQELRRARLHHPIVGLVAAALRRAPGLEDVVVETGRDDAHSVLRPDLRAKNGSSGVVT